MDTIPFKPPNVEYPLVGTTRREDYQYRHAKPCRGCGAMIQWWETPAGKWSPHDADGVSHFATCPFQARFRQPTEET